MKTANWISKSAKAISVGVLCISVSACGANHNSIYRTFEFKNRTPDNQAVATGHFIDAKQRAILSNQREIRGETLITFCAEPNPEVFSVLSSSFAASGNFGTSEKGADAAGEIARAISENGATIARSQTIQILRESMYRTCERYLNSGMDRDELSIQALRDQRTIVSILAIEQLTGVAYPPRTAISATAKADTGDTALKIQENLEKAKKDQESKQKTFDKSSKELDELEKKSKDEAKKHKTASDNLEKARKALTKDPENTDLKNQVDELTKSEGKQKTKAEEAKSEADKKKKEKAAAEKALTDQKKVVASFEKKLESALAVSVDSTTEIKFADCNECNDKKPSPESIKILADAVERIVDQTFELDEIQLKCLKTLDAPDPVAMAKDLRSYEGARAFCLAYLKNTNEKTRLDLLEREKAIKDLENIDFGDPKAKKPKGGQ